MTKHESFKKRVRTRMTKTGERYGAARRALIEQSGRDGKAGRRWVSEPEMAESPLLEATGRGWDEWCDLIDAWDGDHDDHGAVAAHVVERYGIDGWWAQTVTVGYERITGRRLPYQRSDGTFTASRSRTIAIDPVELRAALLDADDRADLFPGIETELRSKPTSKVVRLRVGPGVAQIALDETGSGKVRVAVAHEKLPDPGEVEDWKHYWAEWFDALADA